MLCGLYAYFLFVFVAAGHGAYVLATRRERTARELRRCALTAVAVVVLYAPWLLITLRARRTIIAVLPSGDQPHQLLSFVVPKWCYNLALPFYSGDLLTPWSAALVVPVLVILVVTVAVTLRHAPPRAALFVALLGVPLVLGLDLVDLKTHQHVHLLERYLTPLLLALQIAFAIARGVAMRAAAPWRCAVWSAALLIVLALGGTSSATAVRQPSWWDTCDPYAQRLSAVLDAAPRPLLLARRVDHPEVLLANDRDPDLHVLLSTARAEHPTLPALALDHRYGAVFVLTESPVFPYRLPAAARVSAERLYTYHGENSVAYRFAHLVSSWTHRRAASAEAGMTLWRLRRADAVAGAMATRTL